MNRNYLFLAQGFEEIEALTVVDVLRRAGMDIKTVSVSSSGHVSGAHGIEVTADLLFDDSDYTDAEFLILPGGMPGSTNLYECEKLQQLLTSHASRGGKIAAICAAPAVVLAPLGLLKDKEATCYPGFDKDCRAAGAIMRDAPVIALDKLITGNGPSAALRFALAIVANSMGESQAQQVGSAMLFYPKSMNFYF